MKTESLKYLHFLFIFSLSVFGINLQAQEITYLDAEGTKKFSEEKAQYKIETIKTDENTYLVYKSVRERKRWKKSELISTVKKISNNKYNVYGQKITKDDFIIREILDTTISGYRIKEMDKHGNIFFIAEAINVFPLILNGKCSTYDNDGLVMANLAYANNKNIGETLLFNPADSIHSPLTKNPEYPGGTKNFRIEITRNLKYPVSAYANKAVGTVYIKFLINTDGKVEHIKEAKKADTDLIQESLRAISAIKTTWQPAEYNGVKVPVWYYAKVCFNFGTAKRRF